MGTVESRECAGGAPRGPGASWPMADGVGGRRSLPRRGHDDAPSGTRHPIHALIVPHRPATSGGHGSRDWTAAMTNEERDLISRFVARVGGAPQGGSFGSVPGSATPALPPVDPEADRFISDQFAQHPEARYRVTQMAFVQEAALVEAQNRIRRLEWELQQRSGRAPAAAALARHPRLPVRRRPAGAPARLRPAPGRPAVRAPAAPVSARTTSPACSPAAAAPASWARP